MWFQGSIPPVCRYSQVCSSVQSCSVHLGTEIYSIPSYCKKGEQKKRGGKMKRRRGRKGSDEVGREESGESVEVKAKELKAGTHKQCPIFDRLQYADCSIFA